jgi:hypothetical protein
MFVFLDDHACLTGHTASVSSIDARSHRRFPVLIVLPSQLACILNIFEHLLDNLGMQSCAAHPLASTSLPLLSYHRVVKPVMGQSGVAF